MVEEEDRLDDSVRLEFGIPRRIMEETALFESERSLMRKAVEEICDAFAAARGLPPGRKNGAQARKELRERLFVEFPRRKEIGGKMIRYRDPSYSVIESGDYALYVDMKSRPLSMRMSPSATKDPKSFTKAQAMIKETAQRLSREFVRKQISGNKEIYVRRPASWIEDTLDNLNNTIIIVKNPSVQISPLDKARLFYSYAAILLITGKIDEAREHLEEVLRLCHGIPDPTNPTLEERARRLLNQILSRETLLQVYWDSLELWTPSRSRKIGHMHKSYPNEAWGSKDVQIQPYIFIFNPKTKDHRTVFSFVRTGRFTGRRNMPCLRVPAVKVFLPQAMSSRQISRLKMSSMEKGFRPSSEAFASVSK
ncbi:MAG: tetratricopeptide repeat protein [Bacteroidales bacterium]|nr:tetratricopeptide repeat protein [Bacteroidales bacterium]